MSEEAEGDAGHWKGHLSEAAEPPGRPGERSKIRLIVELHVLDPTRASDFGAMNWRKVVGHRSLRAMVNAILCADKGE